MPFGVRSRRSIPICLCMARCAVRERMERFWDSRFYGALFLIFAAIALLLASIGLYTVIAHSVSQRTQEIGIRMAIGATARDILTLVFRQGMLPVGIGLAIGLAASFAVNRLLTIHARPGVTGRPDHAGRRIRRVGRVRDAGLPDSGTPRDARRSGGRPET